MKEVIENGNNYMKYKELIELSNLLLNNGNKSKKNENKIMTEVALVSLRKSNFPFAIDIVENLIQKKEKSIWKISFLLGKDISLPIPLSKRIFLLQFATCFCDPSFLLDIFHYLKLFNHFLSSSPSDSPEFLLFHSISNPSTPTTPSPPSPSPSSSIQGPIAPSMPSSSGTFNFMEYVVQRLAQCNEEKNIRFMEYLKLKQMKNQYVSFLRGSAPASAPVLSFEQEHADCQLHFLYSCFYFFEKENSNLFSVFHLFLNSFSFKLDLHFLSSFIFNFFGYSNPFLPSSASSPSPPASYSNEFYCFIEIYCFSLACFYLFNFHTAPLPASAGEGKGKGKGEGKEEGEATRLEELFKFVRDQPPRAIMEYVLSQVTQDDGNSCWEEIRTQLAASDPLLSRGIHSGINRDIYLFYFSNFYHLLNFRDAISFLNHVCFPFSLPSSPPFIPYLIPLYSLSLIPSPFLFPLYPPYFPITYSSPPSFPLFPQIPYHLFLPYLLISLIFIFTFLVFLSHLYPFLYF